MGVQARYFSKGWCIVTLIYKFPFQTEQSTTNQYFRYKAELDCNGKLIKPPSDFVISIDASGNILSLYGDNCWDLSPYATSRKFKIHFTYSHAKNSKKFVFPQKIVDEIKWIVFCLMYMVHLKSGSGWLSVTTLSTYCETLRFAATKLFDLNENSLLKVFVDEKKLTKLSTTLHSKKAINLIQIINHLFTIPKEARGFEITGRKLHCVLQALSKSYIESVNQTPLIPSRIYLESIKRNHRIIEEFSEVSERVLSLCKNIISIQGYGRCLTTQRECGNRSGSYQPVFNQAIQDFKLKTFCSSKGIKSIVKLAKYIGSVQFASKQCIHIYTGMRIGEVHSLLYDCYVNEKIDGKYVPFIVGTTTKLTRGRKQVRWLISSESLNAINIAQSIASCIGDNLNIDRSRLKLFISHTHIFSNTGKQNYVCHSKFNDISIPITLDDLTELERIEYHRDWRNEPDYKLGKPWPFRSHQYRRSLAVYGAQSGLITLPSLKRQLKHISAQMALYYAKGSSNIAGLFGEIDSKHMLHEYRNMKPLSDALAYISNILLTDEELFGTHGRYVECRIKPKGLPFIYRDRNKTIDWFKRGEIGYCETPLGACTSVSPCDKKMLGNLSNCISCSKAVIKKVKLISVITQQEKHLRQLEQDSLAYKIELEHLDALKRLMAKIEKDET